MITSKSNPTVKRVNSLKEKKYRAEYGEYIVEGIKQIREAVAAGQKIVSIYYSPRYRGELTEHERSVPVSDEVFGKLSEEVSPQGILAVLEIPENAPAAPQDTMTNTSTSAVSAAMSFFAVFMILSPC